ncbi:MAG: hypothetical protein E7351_01490 [Clostridiales bacterium]|nr:hypothetical protein [Clostridiales bacterium]
MEKEHENTHSGHRQRIKSLFEKHRLVGLDEFRILELILTYVIPQQDTNPLAHRLIDTFLDLRGVLNASYDELVKIKGVGREVALFLQLEGELISAYGTNPTKKKPKLDNVEKSVDYFRKNFPIKDHECMYAVCLNKFCKPIKHVVLTGEDETQVQFDIRTFMSQITFPNVFSVILYHTHPQGNPYPSKEDFAVTNHLIRVCNDVGISLFDHIVMTETSHFSIVRGEQSHT